MVDIETIRNRLKSIDAKNIRFNEPHFTERMLVRGGNRDAVMRHLTQPELLVHVEEQKGKYGDPKYVLYFQISATRTLILPIIFQKQGVYILTFILRHRRWKHSGDTQ